MKLKTNGKSKRKQIFSIKRFCPRKPAKWAKFSTLRLLFSCVMGILSTIVMLIKLIINKPITGSPVHQICLAMTCVLC